MSMLALPEADRQEILMLFRQYLPHVPDAWLQELAANYGKDAVVDIDPNDVIAILSVPGELHRIQLLLSQYESMFDWHRKICNELAVMDIERGQIVACLLTIYDSSSTLAEVGVLWKLVSGECVGKEKSGWAWYDPKPAAQYGKLGCEAMSCISGEHDSDHTSLGIYLIRKTSC